MEKSRKPKMFHGHEIKSCSNFNSRNHTQTIKAITSISKHEAIREINFLMDQVYLPLGLDDKANLTRLLVLLLLPILLLLFPRLRRATAANDSSRLTVCSILLVRLGTLTLMGLVGVVRAAASDLRLSGLLECRDTPCRMFGSREDGPLKLIPPSAPRTPSIKSASTEPLSDPSCSPGGVRGAAIPLNSLMLPWPEEPSDIELREGGLPEMVPRPNMSPREGSCTMGSARAEDDDIGVMVASSTGSTVTITTESELAKFIILSATLSAVCGRIYKTSILFSTTG